MTPHKSNLKVKKRSPLCKEVCSCLQSVHYVWEKEGELMSFSFIHICVPSFCCMNPSRLQTGVIQKCNMLKNEILSQIVEIIPIIECDLGESR